MAAEGYDYLPVGERPEWADLAPLQPPVPPQPVVAIGRDPLLGELMDYFWAAVQQGELSERVLALTEEIIKDLNSSNYTVWEWRWRCVQALGGVHAHAAQEKALTRSVATANPKNYQLWNYRRRVALALGPDQAQEEMAFAAACLQHDAKNYHAWAHRQAVLLAAAGGAAGAAAGSEGAAGAPAAAQARCATLWSAELAFTESLLRQDVRNNSAWNQRIFVLRNAPPSAVGPPAEAYDREVDFAAGQLRLAPHNESAWEALRSLAAGPGAPCHALAADPRFLGLCREVLCGRDGDGGGSSGLPACAHALALLGDVLLDQAALLQEAGTLLEGGAIGGAGAALEKGAVAAAAAAARRLAREVLERQLVADPIKQPFMRLEVAALDAAAAAAVAAGA